MGSQTHEVKGCDAVPESMPKQRAVYQAIASVTEELAQFGISKARKNMQGPGYAFRGIDDVLNALAPLLPKHKLVVLPRVLSRECVERTSQKGQPLFYVTVCVDFDFVSAEDGSRHVVRTYGEAMDSSDKATNKAMSAAYKYAAILAFCIPTEGGMADSEEHTHEPARREVPQFAPPKPIVSMPDKRPSLADAAAPLVPPKSLPPEVKKSLREAMEFAELSAEEAKEEMRRLTGKTESTQLTEPEAMKVIRRFVEIAGDKT